MMHKRILALPEIIATRLMGYWVRPDVLPEEPLKLVESSTPVVYILESGGLADRVALNLVCGRAGLPRPMDGLWLKGKREPRAVVVLRTHKRGLFRFSSTKVSHRLIRIIQAAQSKTPIDSGQSKTPIDSGQSKTPIDSGQSKTPIDSGQSKTPIDSGQSETPTNSGQSKTPIDSGQSKTPTNSGQSKTPIDSGQSKTPIDSAQSEANFTSDPSLAPFIQVIPVAIYWGRSPDREASVLKQLFSENWKVAGRTSKFFKTLVHGRYTLVQFSQPLSLEPILEDRLEASIAARKVSRILRVHFRQRRIATLGPDLSHRRTLINRVLQNSAVVAEVESVEPAKRAKLQEEAAAYAYEIAADISYPSIRVLRKVLTRLWNKLYDGVKLDGINRLTSVAEGRELVYVPCHRSHIDYLLLSYLLYMQGMSLPHIAAGVNLNLPLIGKILRRGGAFFLRRTFKDNRLYGLVFNAYLEEIIQRGHALEYFIEGGRSRTGRLLKPKSGMLAMTAQAYIKEPKRALMFVPINFSYERLVEGGAFASELTGAKKQKETLGGLLRSLKLLRQEFGSVYVNIGTPIDFTKILDKTKPEWREEPVDDHRSEWLKPAVKNLGNEIMTRINTATSVTPVGLLSLSMLTSSHGRLALEDLQRLLELYQKLHLQFAYSDEVVMTDLTPDAIIDHGINLKYIERESLALGEIVSIRTKQTIPLSFFRNNVLHLYILPASVACCFVNRSAVSVKDIQRLVGLSYPYIKAELFLRWDSSELDDLIQATIDQLVAVNLLGYNADRSELHRSASGRSNTWLLLALAESAMPSLQRYYLTASVLYRVGSGRVNAASLGLSCQQCAEHLELVHGLQSPDFYDKELFRAFIDVLIEQERVNVDPDGLLHFDEVFSGVEAEARGILGERVRHSILNITAKSAVVDGIADASSG